MKFGGIQAYTEYTQYAEKMEQRKSSMQPYQISWKRQNKLWNLELGGPASQKAKTLSLKLTGELIKSL